MGFWDHFWHVLDFFFLLFFWKIIWFRIPLKNSLKSFQKNKHDFDPQEAIFSSIRENEMGGSLLALSPHQDEIQLLPLHRNPEYTHECMQILNDQWPRSETLRLRTLSSSSDELPTNLALVKKSSDNNSEVVGHSRINVIPKLDRAVWIESVVIKRDIRGKGYGRVLMEKTEEYARQLNFMWSYLSTHDQQHFYAKLGYSFCPPVTIFGGIANKSFLPKQFITQVLTPESLKNSNMVKSSLNPDETLVDKCQKMKINGNYPEVNGLNYFSNKSQHGGVVSDEDNLSSGVVTHISQLQTSSVKENSLNSSPNNHLSPEVDTKATAPPQKCTTPSTPPPPPPPPFPPTKVGPPVPTPPPPPTTTKLQKSDIQIVESGKKMFMNKCLIKDQ
ncbi:unnamed protein product, partial [Meganyctiphanes norvegica]